MTGKWLARFAADPRDGGAVPIVPIVPIALVPRPFGTNGTIGTRPLQRSSGLETGHRGYPAPGQPASEPDWTGVDEREAMALEGGVPATFARGFALLQLARPRGVSLDRWECAINDAGLFLDAWGHEAERLGWTAPDVVGPSPPTLAWVLEGARVSHLTATAATLSDGRAFSRSKGGVHE